MTSKLHDWFFFGSRTSILWIIGESAGECLWLLSLVKAGRYHVTGVRWHVTCDKWHVTSHVSYAICELWHVTHDFFLLQKVADNLQEVRKIRRKKIKKCLKVQNSFKKGGISLYLCYYPHTLRESVFPVCGILNYWHPLPTITSGRD